MNDRIVVAVNVAATVMTMVVSVIVIADPAFALPAGAEVTAGVETFARACSLRSLAVGGALLVLLARCSGPGLAVLLWVTGLIQLGDAFVHGVNGNPAAVAAGTLALVAFVSVWWFTRACPGERMRRGRG